MCSVVDTAPTAPDSVAASLMLNRSEMNTQPRPSRSPSCDLLDQVAGRRRRAGQRVEAERSATIPHQAYASGAAPPGPGKSSSSAERVVVERDLERPQAAFELLHRARPDDRRRHGGLVSSHASATSAGSCRARRRAPRTSRAVAVLLDARAARPPFERPRSCLRRTPPSRPPCTGSTAGGRGRSRARREAPRARPCGPSGCRGSARTRGRAKCRAVGGLLGLRRCASRRSSRADVEHLALRDQRLHRLPDLVPRRRPVDVVHLVEVDVVGLQPAQDASHAWRMCSAESTSRSASPPCCRTPSSRGRPSRAGRRPARASGRRSARSARGRRP